VTARALRSAAFLAVAALLATVVALLILRSTRDQVPASHDWTVEWQTAPPVVSTTPGGFLEASTMRMVEHFYKSDRKTWWGIYLGETISHIQMAATYRYGVPLSDPAWEIVTRDQVCVVLAPALRPSLPVAIDTSTMEEKTENGWARFDKQINLEDLRRGVSGELAERAGDPDRMALARGAARRTIGEFVEQWLLTRGEWQAGPFSAVTVYFPDEVDDGLRDRLRTAR
jgi:hypothetical protein